LENVETQQELLKKNQIVKERENRRNEIANFVLCCV